MPKRDQLKNRIEEIFSDAEAPVPPSEAIAESQGEIDQDAAAQQRMAEILEKRVRELNCLNDIGHRIDEKPDLDEFLHWVVTRIPDAMQYPGDCVVAIEYDNQVYGEPQAIQLPSKMVGGLRVAGELVGWLHIAYKQPHEFIDAESALVGSIVSRVSGYIEGRRQQEQAYLRSEELTVLNEMGRVLTSVLDLPVILENIFRYTGRLMYASNLFVALYDARNGMISFPLAYSDNEPAEIEPHPLGAGGMTDYIIRTGEVLLMSDNVTQRMQELGIAFVTFADDQPAVSWLGVPIIYGERVLGVIAVQSTTVPGLYKEHERDILIGVSQQAANAIAISQQNAQMQAALEEVRESQQLLKSVIDTIPNPIFFKDVHGIYSGCNQAFLQYLGRTEDEVVGKSVYDFISDEKLAEQLHQADEKLFEELGQRVSEAKVLYADGSEHQMIFHRAVIIEPDGGPAGLVGVMVDITERKQAEVVLAKRAAELATAAQVSTAAATIINPDELLQTVADLTRERFGLYHAHIYLLNSTTGALVLSAGAGEVGRKMVAQGWQIPLERAQSLVAQAARERQGVIVNDVRAEPGFLPNELLPGTAAELAVPIIAGEELLGVLDVQSDRVDAFTEQDVAIQTTLAYQVAVALQNARQYERTQRALMEAELLYVGSSKVAAARTMDEILRSLVEATALQLMDRANILFFDRPWTKNPPEHLVVSAVWEKSGQAPANPIGMIYPFQRFPAFRLMQRDEVTVVNDILTDERSDPNLRKLLQSLGMRSLIACPLRVGGEWIGIVTGQSAETLQLTPEDIRRVVSLIDQAATAAQNLRLIDQTQAALADSNRSQELLRSIIDATPDWIFIKNREHRYQLVNRGYADSLKLAPEAFIGKDDLDLGFPEEIVKGNPEKGIRGFWADDIKVMESGETMVVSSEPAVVDGRQIYLNTIKVPLRDENGQVWGVLGFVRDITDRELLLMESEQQAARLAMLNQMGATLNQAESEKEILQIAGANVLKILEVERASVAMLDPSGDTFEVFALSGEAGAIPLGVHLPVEGTAVGKAIRSNQLLVLPGEEPMKAYLDGRQLAQQRIRTTMNAPLAVGNRVIGTLNVGCKTRNIFSQSERVLMVQIAALISSALSNRRLIEQIQTRVQQEQNLHHIATQLRGSTDSASILRTAVRELGTVLGRRTFVRMRTPEESEQVPEGDAPGENGNQGNNLSSETPVGGKS